MGGLWRKKRLFNPVEKRLLNVKRMGTRCGKDREDKIGKNWNLTYWGKWKKKKWGNSWNTFLVWGKYVGIGWKNGKTPKNRRKEVPQIFQHSVENPVESGKPLVFQWKTLWKVGKISEGVNEKNEKKKKEPGEINLL